MWRAGILAMLSCHPFPTPSHRPKVLEHCREVYGDRQARANGEEAAGASAAQTAAAVATAQQQAKGGRAPTAKEVAFRAVVNACRRRSSGAALASPSKPALQAASAG